MSTEEYRRYRRRKPRRSRRLVKKLARRADVPQTLHWNVDAISVDGGKRFISAQEIVERGLQKEVRRVVESYLTEERVRLVTKEGHA